MTRLCPLCDRKLKGDERKPYFGVIACQFCWDDHCGNDVSLKAAIDKKKEQKMKATKKKPASKSKKYGCSHCGESWNPKIKFHPYSGFGYKKLCEKCYDELSEKDKEWEDEEEDETDEEPQVKSKAKPIHEHEGKKYLRLIHSAHPDNTREPISVDVYAVLEAFGVTCPGRQQAIKKLLCAGLRGKGSQVDDLVGAMAALNRAIELQQNRENKDVAEDCSEES